MVLELSNLSPCFRSALLRPLVAVWSFIFYLGLLLYLVIVHPLLVDPDPIGTAFRRRPGDPSTVWDSPAAPPPSSSKRPSPQPPHHRHEQKQKQKTQQLEELRQQSEPSPGSPQHQTQHAKQRVNPNVNYGQAKPSRVKVSPISKNSRQSIWRRLPWSPPLHPNSAGVEEEEAERKTTLPPTPLPPDYTSPPLPKSSAVGPTAYPYSPYGNVVGAAAAQCTITTSGCLKSPMPQPTPR
ncbi:hypothetical protein Vafri_13226, partial [Volvox africanus]